MFALPAAAQQKPDVRVQSTPQTVELKGAAAAANLAITFASHGERTVLIDARPGGYKIGESVVPEQFEHPVMRALLPRVRELPSYTTKHGTTFISDDSVAAFPLPAADAKLAMHVARSELEQLIAREWSSPIRVETIPAGLGSVTVTLSGFGEVRSVRVARLAPEVSGVVVPCP